MRSSLLAVALVACGGTTSLPVDADCNPLGAGDACLAPWPSSAFEVDDPATPTGRRLALPAGAIPRGAGDAEIDPARWNVLDGFAGGPIVIAFPGGVASDDLPPADNMDLSLAPDSPTIILDMTTGTRVSHHGEIDADSQALVLRPAARLEPGHRYAVAITDRLLARDGEALEVSPGFAALRDNRTTDHPLLEHMRPRFEDVLVALDDAGVPADGADLVIAWDFTVASDQVMRADLGIARDRALATLATHPPLVAVTSDSRLSGVRTIAGTLDAPLILSNGGEARAGTRVVRDDNRQPAIQGLYRIAFTAVVPDCARNAPVVLYGHRAFGDASEVTSTSALASELCMTVIGTDLRGVSAADLPALQRVADDLENTDEIFDVALQGAIDQTALIAALRGVLGRVLTGRIDPSRIYYLADGALGAITIAALSPAIQRAAIIEPADLDRVLAKARLANTYPDPLTALLVRQLLALSWERIESVGFGGHPPLLVHAKDPAIAITLARSLKLPLVTPAATTPWGITSVPHPAHAGLVIGGNALPLVREFFTAGTISPLPLGSSPPM
jgi:hypothetical protein